jgi:sugar phosphate isomerase/epimerase
MSHYTNRRSLLRKGAAGAAGITAILASRHSTAIEPVNRTGGPRIKLSCCAYSYRQYLQSPDKRMTLEDFIDECARMGLDGVELTSYYFPPDTNTAYLNRLKRRVFFAGMSVSGTAIGGSFTVPPGTERQKQIELTRTWIDRSAELGAPCMRVFAGTVPKEAGEEDARRWCLECLEECCGYASKRGVMLALENHGGITATADQLLLLVKAVKSDWFGVNLDTGNFVGSDPYEQIARAAPYAITTHIKTSVGSAGPADFKRLVDILKSAGYRGYLSMEYEDRENPMTAVPRYMAQLQKLVG